jgi:hypothetical protein
MAAVGRNSSAMQTATRTTAKRAGAEPSAYAHARSGVVAERATGRASAARPTAISSAA